jgi:hypothetical protein
MRARDPQTDNFVTHRKWRSGRGVSCRLFHCAVCTECRSSLLPAEALSADPLLDQKVKSMFVCSYFRQDCVTLWGLGWSVGSVWGGAVKVMILDNRSSRWWAPKDSQQPTPSYPVSQGFLSNMNILPFDIPLNYILTCTLRCLKLHLH